MSKYLFVINDVGTSFAITDTRVEMDDNFEVDPALYFETTRLEFFETVKDLVNGNNDVRFLKSVVDLTFEDLVVTPLDALTVYKTHIRSKGTHLLKQHCDFILQFDFFEFSLLNNKFIDAGYVITDANREAKYLDIINTGNELLISDLDAYLECRDRIAISVHNYKNYLTFKTNVNDAADLAAVDSAYTTFAMLYS